MDTHETYLVRVWLPDRPGALGCVAARFGSLKGDVVGLEIIERGAAWRSTSWSFRFLSTYRSR